jgi:LysR family tcuABC transcriptional regulator
MPLIEAMARRYPLIRLQLVEGMSGHLAGMLKARQIDLAVLFNTESVTFARSEAIPLLDESLFLFGAVANSIDTMEVSQSKSPVTLAEAALLPLILPSRSHGLRVSLDRAFASANVSPRIIMEIDSLAVIMEAVSNRLGYTIQPGAALSRSAVGVFNVRPVADESVYRTNLLASLPEHELSPAALALRAQLRKTVGWLVREGRWLGTTLHES